MSFIHKRLYVLTAILAVGYSAIWLLPKSESMRSSRLSRHLPLQFDSMLGKRVAIKGPELKILAKDTEFERVQYANSLNSEQPAVEVSVVFSGKDINNSIHRPERCLKSQGWNFSKERTVTVEGAMPGGGDLRFREIVCSKPLELKDGRKITVQRVQYYTFFGHRTITESHYLRTFSDMKDRLFKGYDQQWAYATFSMPVTQIYADQGLADPSEVHTLEQTEQMLEDFIRKLAPLVIDRQIEKATD